MYPQDLVPRRRGVTRYQRVRQRQALPPQRSPLHEWLHPPRGWVWQLADAGIWLASAMALRVGVAAMVAIAPALGPLGMLLLLTPAAIGVGLSRLLPQLTLLLGYRLVLIGFGVLIGGSL